MANLYNEEIQKIYIDIESGDLPDISAKAEESTAVERRMYEPIYNKFIWGYLFTGTYMALLRGLTGRVSMTVIRAVEGKVVNIQ